MFNSRKQGYRYTLQISRGPNCFQPILWASWSPTPCGALETNQRKCGPLLETHEHHRLRNMFRTEDPPIDPYVGTRRYRSCIRSTVCFGTGSLCAIRLQNQRWDGKHSVTGFQPNTFYGYIMYVYLDTFLNQPTYAEM